MKVRLVDSRSNKAYSGDLKTDIEIGKKVIILLEDKGLLGYQFDITPLQRCLRIGQTFWMIDKQGVKFTLTVENSQ